MMDVLTQHQVTTTLIIKGGVVGFSLTPKPNLSYLNFR